MSVVSRLSVVISRTEAARAFPLPAYATLASAGVDLQSVENLVLPPGARMLVSTGISIALPPGYEAQIRPRSGLALKYGITLANSPGTIDADYRGEIKVILQNLGTEPFSVNVGDRIAQMIIAPIVQVDWHESGELNETERGSGGFGSTGR